MVRLTPDSLSQKIAFVAVVFGVIALVLACVGLGTPNWAEQYATTSTGYYTTNVANFWYACVFNSDGSLNRCTTRTNNVVDYPSYLSSYPWGGWMTDYGQHILNAGALCIVGIIFLFLGTLFTLIMALIYLQTWVNLIPPILLFLACIFMVAGLAEGSLFILYRGYSAHLFQTGQLLTMFTLALSSLAAGRIHFSRWTEAGRNTSVK